MPRYLIKRIALSVGLVVLCIQPALAQESASEKSLYDRLGGLMGISAVVDDFIDVIVADEQINKNPAVAASRDRVPAAYLKYHVTAMVCQVTGGPCQYNGRSMKDSHSNLNITQAEWDRMVVIFKKTLAKYKVPEKEVGELLAIVGTTKGDIVKPGK